MNQAERKATKEAHKQALHKFNELQKRNQLDESIQTGKPVFNVNAHVKLKPNERNRPAANRTREMYNHHPERS